MQTTQTRRSRNGRARGPRNAFSSSRPRHGSSARAGSRGRNRSRRGSGGRGRVMPTFDPSQFINTNPVEVKEEVYVAKHKFADFPLNGKLKHTISKMGLSTPSPIQDQLIEHILEGRDAVGLAETGTGKTAAFLIPLIQKTLQEYDRQTLILAPTRELAVQIDGEFRKLIVGHKLYSTVCVGGVAMGGQIRGLHRKNHFIIGTPGRVLDLINRNHIDTTRITTVVLDEADRMLDMGFIGDMRKILRDVPTERETYLISATMNKGCEELTSEFLNDPVTVSVKKKDVTNSIAQDVVHYNGTDKFDILLKLLRQDEFKRVLVFGAMKHSVEKLAKDLTANNIVAESIHGNKSHGQRQRSLARFKSGNARVLVATDVAARGIHVDKVSHVINYDLPNTFDDYVHRIGRTGRGEERGKALTFVTS